MITLIAATRGAGATRVTGVHFWLSDEEVHLDRATRAAVPQAFGRARALAGAAGATLGRVVRLGTPEALAATLGSGGVPGGYAMGDLQMSHAASPSGFEEGRDDPEPLILPVPIAVSAIVHGAWEVATAPRAQDAAGA